MSRRPSPAVYVSRELSELLEGEPRFRRWIDEMGDVLRDNMFAGDAIPKRLIPRVLKERYGVTNLYRYRLPEGYRALYTLIYFEGVGVCPVILMLLSHGDYEHLFGYRDP